MCNTFRLRILLLLTLLTWVDVALCQTTTGSHSAPNYDYIEDEDQKPDPQPPPVPFRPEEVMEKVIAPECKDDPSVSAPKLCELFDDKVWFELALNMIIKIMEDFDKIRGSSESFTQAQLIDYIKKESPGLSPSQKAGLDFWAKNFPIVGALRFRPPAPSEKITNFNDIPVGLPELRLAAYVFSVASKRCNRNKWIALSKYKFSTRCCLCTYDEDDETKCQKVKKAECGPKAGPNLACKYTDAALNETSETSGTCHSLGYILCGRAAPNEGKPAKDPLWGLDGKLGSNSKIGQCDYYGNMPSKDLLTETLFGYPKFTTSVEPGASKPLCKDFVYLHVGHANPTSGPSLAYAFTQMAIQSSPPPFFDNRNQDIPKVEIFDTACQSGANTAAAHAGMQALLIAAGWQDKTDPLQIIVDWTANQLFSLTSAVDKSVTGSSPVQFVYQSNICSDSFGSITYPLCSNVIKHGNQCAAVDAGMIVKCLDDSLGIPPSNTLKVADVMCCRLAKDYRPVARLDGLLNLYHNYKTLAGKNRNPYALLLPEQCDSRDRNKLSIQKLGQEQISGQFLYSDYITPRIRKN